MSSSLLVSQVVSSLLFYSHQSLQVRKAKELRSFHSRKDQLVELMVMPQDGAGHFTDTGPWSFSFIALYVPWLNLSPAGSLLWKSALAGDMGVHKQAGIWHMLNNRHVCFIWFLFYTFLKILLLLLCSRASQDVFMAGQQSFCPSVEKPSRLIVFTKTPCWSQQPRMMTWQHNAIFMSIMMLFCFEREKNYTSRSYRISYNFIKTLENRHLGKKITCLLWL